MPPSKSQLMCRIKSLGYIFPAGDAGEIKAQFIISLSMSPIGHPLLQIPGGFLFRKHLFHLALATAIWPGKVRVALPGFERVGAGTGRGAVLACFYGAFKARLDIVSRVVKGTGRSFLLPRLLLVAEQRIPMVHKIHRLGYRRSLRKLGIIFAYFSSLTKLVNDLCADFSRWRVREN